MTAVPGNLARCNPPQAAPSQINLLAINATAVGVSFVTADDGLTARAAALAEFRAVGGAAMAARTASGFSTLYTDPKMDHYQALRTRHLSYHHVILAGLLERTEYEYRVRSGGGDSAAWSPWNRFRSVLTISRRYHMHPQLN